MHSVLYTTDSENGKDSCLKERRVQQNSIAFASEGRNLNPAAGCSRLMAGAAVHVHGSVNMG